MSTAITAPAHSSSGLSYTQNVKRAAYALLSALLAITPTARETPNNSTVAACGKRKKDEISLRRLYRLAASSESVMPNLAQELNLIARRN
ncbi:MAG TPA: hypothetical protein VM571_15150 [Noviherbaspirillum sp.]|nr:hypothetical protein [Noviherbaspirillum sp.]